MKKFILTIISHDALQNFIIIGIIAVFQLINNVMLGRFLEKNLPLPVEQICIKRIILIDRTVVGDQDCLNLTGSGWAGNKYAGQWDDDIRKEEVKYIFADDTE